MQDPAAWLNQNSGAIQALSTVVLVLITGWYATLTYRLTRSTERQYELSRQSELLKQHQEALRVSGLAAALLDTAEKALRRAIPELIATMQSAKWQAMRDELELSAITVGGVIHQDASAAVQSLRNWDQLARRAARNPMDGRALWDEAELALKSAVESLRKLQQIGTPSASTPK